MPISTYFWIALGSAFGGVSRAWMTLAMARVAGASFPWGTILVNVLGSFIIGLFSALTAASGRWPAAAEVRLFVMVGVCGGFTTFSSFSLQTLELARDGRVGQALANIVLSLLVCLAAVTAGLYGAEALNRLR